jgi:hypothetical protein
MSKSLAARSLLALLPGLLAYACAAGDGDGDDGGNLPGPFGQSGSGGQASAPNASAGASGLPAGGASGLPAGAGGTAPSTGTGGTGPATGAGGTGPASGAGGTTGAGGTGNPTGSGGTDATGAGGTAPTEPTEPLPAGFFLIDDFEGGRDPQWSESEVGGGAGNFTIDTSLGANGSSSSLRVDANNAFHTMLQFALPQAVRDANEVYGRVFLRLAANPSGAHYVWLEVGTTANDGHEMRLGHNVGQLQSNHWLNGEQDIRDQSRALVANTWYCLEFFMDNSPEQLQVWLDDEETALSTTNYTAGAGAQGNGNAVADFIPPLDAFRIGWELQNGTVYFDDVALGSQRIGCDP